MQPDKCIDIHIYINQGPVKPKDLVRKAAVAKKFEVQGTQGIARENSAMKASVWEFHIYMYDNNNDTSQVQYSKAA